MIPTIVLAEIYCWAKQTEIEDMKEKLLKAVRKIEIIDFDALCASEQEHFNEKIDYTKSRQATKTDNLICACCKVNNCENFLTTDQKLIDRMEKLNSPIRCVQVDSLTYNTFLFNP